VKKDNKQFWQRAAKIYSRFMKSSDEMYDAIAKKASPYLSRDMNVLELACGTGQLSYRLFQKVRLWEATDFSENMIAEAKKNNASCRLHFSVQDATELPYAPESFDAVVIANALHIMPDPNAAMREIRRVLKKDGALFAPTFVHGESAGYRIRINIMKLGGFKTYHEWNAAEFAAYVSGWGYHVKDDAVIGSKLTPLCCLIAKKGR